MHRCSSSTATRSRAAPDRVRVADAFLGEEVVNTGPAPVAAATWRSTARPPKPARARSRRDATAGSSVPARTRRHEHASQSADRHHPARISPGTRQARAYASIVRGARPRSAQMPSHSAARACRSRTGHLPDTAASIPRETRVPVGLRRHYRRPAALTRRHTARCVVVTDRYTHPSHVGIRDIANHFLARCRSGKIAG